MNLRNQEIDLNESIIRWPFSERLNGYFKRICGYMPDDYECELAARLVVENLKARAIFSEYNFSDIINDKGSLEIEGHKIDGGIFNYYDTEDSKKILVYLLTLGPLPKAKSGSLLEEFYIDAWGSALVEEAHDIFKEKLENIYGENFFVSDPFGPGYYGIQIDETKKIFKILDATKIGLILTESGMMLPEKSCSGFYVISSEKTKLPLDNCSSCLGTNHCEYCRKYSG